MLEQQAAAPPLPAGRPTWQHACGHAAVQVPFVPPAGIPPHPTHPLLLQHAALSAPPDSKCVGSGSQLAIESLCPDDNEKALPVSDRLLAPPQCHKVEYSALVLQAVLDCPCVLNTILGALVMQKFAHHKFSPGQRVMTHQGAQFAALAGTRPCLPLCNPRSFLSCIGYLKQALHSPIPASQ